MSAMQACTTVGRLIVHAFHSPACRAAQMRDWEWNEGLREGNNASIGYFRLSSQVRPSTCARTALARSAISSAVDHSCADVQY